MKLKILGLVGGAAALALASTTASADTDIYVGLDFGGPVYVEREPRVVYYERYEPAPVYYDYDRYPRTYVYREEVRYYSYDEPRRHHKGRHRGHHKHHHWD